MATSDDVKTWLVANVPTQLASLTTPSAPLAYAGQRERVNSADFDILVRFVNSLDIQRDTGLRRHLFELSVTIIGIEDSEESTLSAILESAARILVAAYDGQVATADAAIANASIERIRVYREQPIGVEVKRGAVNKRSLIVYLQIDEWGA